MNMKLGLKGEFAQLDCAKICSGVVLEDIKENS
jgi:hypothetical protein